MKVTKKSEADRILTDSLFNPVNGHTLNVMKFDGAKLEWHGSLKHYIGREVPHIRGIHAVYVVRRQDSDGPYAQLMCICE